MRNVFKRSWVLVLLLLLMIVFVGSGFAEEKTSDAKALKNQHQIPSDIKYLMFSSTKYSAERNMVKKHEHITAKQLKKGKIYIALEDLNGDGTKEIFAYIDIFEYCGQIGCILNIYQKKSEKLISLLSPKLITGLPIFLEMDKKGEQNLIGILSTKTTGWRDIFLRGETVWKWNGKNY